MSNKNLLEKSTQQPTKTQQLELLINKKHQQIAQRVFPPQTFLFKFNEEQKAFSQKKNNFTTLSSFKQKSEKGSLAESTSFNKRYESRVSEIARQRNMSKIEKIFDSEYARVTQRQNGQLLRKAIEEKQRSKDPFSLKNYINTSEQPQLKISVLPKQSLKQMFSKNKVNPESNRDYLNELGYRMKKTMAVKLEDIDARLTEMTSQNVLELMTIFSIKEQEVPKAREQILKKKQLFKSLVPEKQRKMRYKKKNYQENELQIDINTDKTYFKKIYGYLCFLSKVNISNGLTLKTITLNERYNNEKVQVFVGNGNNKYLLIGLLRRRFWLEVANKVTKNTKFIWTQNSIKEAHAFQQNSRTLKKNTTNRTQAGLEDGAKGDQRQAKHLLSPFRYFTLAAEEENSKPDKHLGIRDEKLQAFKIRENLSQLRTQNTRHNKKLFISEKAAQNAQRALKNFKINSKSKPVEFFAEHIHTITNHVPHNSFIGSKKALFYTMQHYYREVKKIDPFTIIPKTYHFKALDEQAYKRFLQQQKQSNQKSIWIVKPGECSNRGNGISLMKASQVTRKLLKKQFHQNGQPKTTIVQSYITEPLLYCGRKFDIRHYLMITIINGNLKAYWYSQGYLRTSSEFFSLQNLGNPFVHLTNDAVQKNSDKYGKYEPGNKLSYSEFQRYLDNTHTRSRVNFREQILPLMKEIATDVVRANYLNIDKERKMNNFQIFGMDFMIDSKYRPWLIEVNANPCLQISCHLLSRIIPIMVEHSLRLGLDPLILPPSHYPPINRYYLPDNFIENLRYEVIFDENEDRCKLDRSMDLNYDFEFDQPEDEYENEGAEIDLNKVLD